MNNPRVKTEEEVREEFLACIRGYAEYWAKQLGKTSLEKCNGLAFSILGIFDGVTIELPGMDIVLRPHESDQEFLQGIGRNWVEDGMVINDCQLHELFYE